MRCIDDRLRIRIVMDGRNHAMLDSQAFVNYFYYWSQAISSTGNRPKTDSVTVKHLGAAGVGGIALGANG